MEQIVAAVEGMLKCCLAQPLHRTPGASYEIEARLGYLLPSVKAGKTVFKPGVSPKHWEEIYRRLRLCKTWSTATDLSHQKDTFHTHPEFGLIRTSLLCPGDEPTVTHMHKSKKGFVDVPLPEFAAFTSGGEEGGGIFAVRICLSVERYYHALSMEQFIPEERSRRVRHKQRATFVLNHTLEYSLTRTFSGKDYLSADRAMDGTPTFEAELECIDVSNLISRYGDVRLAAKSFAMKVYDFVDGKDWSTVAMAVGKAPPLTLEEAVTPPAAASDPDDIEDAPTPPDVKIKRAAREMEKAVKRSHAIMTQARKSQRKRDRKAAGADGGGSDDGSASDCPRPPRRRRRAADHASLDDMVVPHPTLRRSTRNLVV